jgi:5'-methylthioadenosine phosphorylase
MREGLLGIIGGSGLYTLPGLEDVEHVDVETPYGSPSDTVVRGRLDGKGLCFLSRHGRGHRLLPSELPFRANIWALKSLGCRWILSVSAVGSLREGLAPGHVVVADQFVDRTRARPRTFFGEGVVAHVSMADPVSPILAEHLARAARAEGATVHEGGTYVCIEGPTFGTRADSELYRSWGMSVVGMTNVPEGMLAREAEIAYATMALVTDYDCWKDEAVSVERVLETVQANAELAVRTVARLARELPFDAHDPICHDALGGAIMTAREAIPESAVERLKPIIERYL